MPSVPRSYRFSLRGPRRPARVPFRTCGTTEDGGRLDSNAHATSPTSRSVVLALSWQVAIADISLLTISVQRATWPQSMGAR